MNAEEDQIASQTLNDLYQTYLENRGKQSDPFMGIDYADSSYPQEILKIKNKEKE